MPEDPQVPAPGLTWSPLPPPPDAVRLVASEHPWHEPTPEEARRIAAGTGCWVWHDTQRGLAGVAAFSQNVAWRLGSGGRLELEFARPGKGSGYFVLVFAPSDTPDSPPIGIARAEPFDDETFVWFLALAQTLAEAIGCTARLIDVGADA